jgi:murein DD-endopeptidase MepM/ murein hydrolase activator NlpD
MSYSLQNTGRNTSFYCLHGRRLFSLIAISLVVAGCWMFRGNQSPVAGPEEEENEMPVVIPGLLFTFPTPQTRLDETNNPAVLMPTESGRIESAWYGSTRTRKFGKQYLSAFHEGVDIAPMERDAKGRAQDPVFAVADGCIGYINRTAGNSSYGIYVVLLHNDVFGEYYTLYSHLASAGSELSAGDTVARGAEIGRMGHTSTLGIPVQRSHLHFEFGTILNDRFSSWYRKEKLKPFHGTLHGYNLAGLNPMHLFPYMISGELFDMLEYIRNYPVAFRLIVPVAAKPDYYLRYPSLWSGDEPAGAIVMDVSENGVPLQARCATGEEMASLKKRKPRVLEAFPEILGRNGARLVVEQGGSWVPGRNADQWLEILLYR